MSCHPKHTEGNIPFSLALRIISAVSDADTGEQYLQELVVHLKNQHYSVKLIENGKNGRNFNVGDTIGTHIDILPFVNHL